MARGTWEDFTSKWGFGDGDQTEGRDFRARDILVRLLNEQPEFKAEKIRALAFDRAGMHNACLILLATAIEGKSDDELLESLDSANESDLPDMEADMAELVGDAYDEADEAKEDDDA